MTYLDFGMETKTAGGAEGTFEGMLSVYDLVDLGQDVVKKGAFTKTIEENKGKVPLLWQHKSDQPIGMLDLEDTDRGLAVKGKLLLELRQAQEAYALVKAGVIRGLSIGYDAIDKEIQNGIRHLKQLKLWEGSLVTFPMLPAAQITSAKSITDIRAFERFLRESGFSRARATALAKHGFDGPEDGADDEALDAFAAVLVASGVKSGDCCGQYWAEAAKCDRCRAAAR